MDFCTFWMQHQDAMDTIGYRNRLKQRHPKKRANRAHCPMSPMTSNDHLMSILKLFFFNFFERVSKKSIYFLFLQHTSSFLFRYVRLQFHWWREHVELSSYFSSRKMIFHRNKVKSNDWTANWMLVDWLLFQYSHISFFEISHSGVFILSFVLNCCQVTVACDSFLVGIWLIEMTVPARI